jgi:hypothetical protein
LGQLNLIYHFQASQNQDSEFKPARYKIIYFFNDQEQIEESLLREILMGFPEANFEQMAFLSLDDLRAFALRVAQKLQSGVVKLLSVQDYNIGIDGAKDLESFRDIFLRYGESVINEEAQKKKGLLAKLFS